MSQQQGRSDFTLEDLVNAVKQLSSRKKTASQVFHNFNGLFTCKGKNTSVIELKSKFHHLVFNAEKTAGLSDEELQTVFQEPVKNVREKHLGKSSASNKDVLGVNGFQIDLSSISPALNYGEFNLLCQRQGVLVPNLTGRSEKPHELEVAVNLAIAMTSCACRKGEGMVRLTSD